MGITPIMTISSSSNVADYILASLNGFKDLCDAPHIWESGLQRDASQRNDTEPTSLLKLKDEQSRFMVWSGNVGAHRSGHSSLYHRLRDASNIRDHTIQILCDLIELLGDTKEILDGKAAPNHQQHLSLDMLIDDSNDEGFPLAGLSVASELSQILLSIAKSIDCLFRLSVSINNPFPHDHLKRASSTDSSRFESFDIDCVRKKFPTASDAITERLGKANSRRRQYFKYRKLYHQKIASGLEDSEDHIAESIQAASLPPGLSLRDLILSELREAETSSVVSNTSYPMSGTIPEQLKVPALPTGAQDGPFECPFCFMMISASSKRLWKKHVFSDLCAYICVDLECPAPDQDFQYRHQWIDHVRKYHWRIWTCCLGCDNTFISLEGVVAHLTQVHSAAVASASFKSLLSICEKPKPVDDSAECPLCKETLDNFKQYQRHVGRHQEDLALFTLPQHSETDDEHDDDEQPKAKEGETGRKDEFEPQNTPLGLPSKNVPAHQGFFSRHSPMGVDAMTFNSRHSSELPDMWHDPLDLPDLWQDLSELPDIWQEQGPFTRRHPKY